MRQRTPLRGFLLVALLMESVLCVGVARSADLHGRVLDPQGRGVRDAEVRLYFVAEAGGRGVQRLSETRTDGQGRFTLERPAVTPPRIVVGSRPVMRCYLAACRLPNAPAIVPVEEGRSRGYELELSVGRSVRCTVQGAPPDQREGTVVSVLRIEGWHPRGVAMASSRHLRPFLPLLGELCRAETDAKGVAVLKGVPRGEVWVAACRKDKDRGVVRGQRVENGEVHLHLDARRRMLAARQVTGRVTRARTGEPLEGILIQPSRILSFGPYQMPPEGFRTDAKGRISLPLIAFMGFGSVMVRDPSESSRYGARLQTRPMGWPPRPGGQREPLSVKLSPGRLIHGVLTDATTKEPIEGAVIGLSIRGPRRERKVDGPHRHLPPARGCLLRTTDGDGRYRFRVDESITAASLHVARAREGKFAANRVAENLPLEGLSIRRDMHVKLLEGLGGTVTVRKPDGSAAGGATVLVDPTATGRPDLFGRTNHGGRVRLRGLVPGDRLRTYVRSRGGGLASYGTLKVGDIKDGASIRLQEAKAGTVVFRDEHDEALRGRATAYLVSREGDTLFRLDNLSGGRQPEAKRFVVRGLLPGLKYGVRGSVRSYQRTGKGRHVEWQIGEEEAEPRLVMRFKKRKRPKPPRPVRPMEVGEARPALSEEEFSRKLKSLRGGALWQKEDPRDESLTWFGQKEGIVLVDSEERHINRFPGLLGLESLVVNDIAFGPKNVWVASDRGLLAWSRELGSWSRYAPSFRHMESHAVGVAVGEDGAVRATLRTEEGKRKKFTRDPESERWSPVE